MRRTCGKAVATRRGDLVEIAARLSRGATHARLFVWSAIAGDEMSPHVQQGSIDTLVNGRPVMLTPTHMRLDTHRKKSVIRFIADDDLYFCVMQEIDVSDEPMAIVRIKAHGKTYQGVRRLLQDAVRFLRRDATRGIRLNEQR